MNNWFICWFFMHPLNAELNPICHLLALLGGANIVVISRLRVKLNSVALVRERTIPTERPPPVSEVVPTFADRGVSRGQRNGSPPAVNLCFVDRSRYFFYSSSSSVNLQRLTRLSGPRSRPTTTQKNLVAPGIETGTSVSVARNSDH